MTSPFDVSKRSDCWNQDKWKGQFSVQWRIIKDISNTQLRHIRLEYFTSFFSSFSFFFYLFSFSFFLFHVFLFLLFILLFLLSIKSFLFSNVLRNNENKPVTNSRDTQEILYNQGCEMLKIFSNYQTKTSILNDFSFYNECEEKEKEVKKKR